ncbi:MAG: protease HtpX [Rhodospirillaceae bacterium]|nr:protease HtpX [Rhodospirillaceae bacterium]|tara:strand:- start:3524 stop:4405 length:882 start_codon:yes stop_codon:yes gene_type:complete
MNRIILFLGTNIAILVVLSIFMRLLGVESLLAEQGTSLDLQALLVFSAVIGFTGSFVSLVISKWSAKRLTGARVIDSPKNSVESWLLNTVQRQAKMADIGMPEVAIYEAPDVNAFATGANRNNALVAVSTGLLKQLGEKEVEAVLAHEVSHVANGDMVTLALIQGVVNTFVVFLSRVVGFMVDRLIFRTQRGYGPGFYIASIIAQIVLGILASTIVMWFSRQREFRADFGGARMAGRDNMISALEQLRRVHQPSDLPESMQAFGISAGKASGFRKLFMSHPPLEERIAALRKL